MPHSATPPLLIGVDFTCAPGPRKPITVALGRRQGAVLRLEGLQALPTLAAFEDLLQRPGPWLGGFDFPFGLPRPFVDALALSTDSAGVIAELRRRCATRMHWRALIDTWGNARPPGQRLLHRATDTATPGICSSSPLQTRYVPVGFMYFEGLHRLVQAGATVPHMHAGDPARVALEAYPGLLAFELIGHRSYKNKNLGDRLIARKEIVERLEQGRTKLGLRVQLGNAAREALVDDASGDRLDALLCLVQAAWASGRADHGLASSFDPVEGWIVSAGQP